MAARPPLLALATGWVALFAWSGMVTQPLDASWSPTLLVGLVMVLAGSRPADAAACPSYVVAAGAGRWSALLGLNLIFAARQSFLGLVPTARSVREVVYVDRQRRRDAERLRLAGRRSTRRTPGPC